MILQKDLLARAQMKLSSHLINFSSICINLFSNLWYFIPDKCRLFLCIYFAAAAEMEPVVSMFLMYFLY